MMTSDYPDPSFSGDFLPVERVCRARYTPSSLFLEKWKESS
ncbi:unknown [Bacteroides sp. CAG:1060]|nr:unknown [Bacteroides sp. CAG:1060]